MKGVVAESGLGIRLTPPAVVGTLPQTLPFGSAPSTTNLGTETLQPGAQSPPYPINWISDGQFVTTPFTVPAGVTTFTIRYSAAVAASRQISLDGNVIFNNQTFPATNNFQTWATISFVQTLAAGAHSMTMLFSVAAGSHDFINPDNLKLTAGASPVTVTTTSLPSGTVGIPYNVSLVAAGGQAPYVWAVTGGVLPAGLSGNGLTGVISGTPTVQAAPSVTFRATDQLGQTASRALTLTINPASSGAAGKAAIRNHIGQQQPLFQYLAALTSKWNACAPVGPNPWPANWNSNTAVEGGVPGDFSFVGAPPLVYRIGQFSPSPSSNNTIATMNSGVHDGTMTADAHALEAVARAQGNVPQWIRLFYEYDADWMDWAIGGQGNLNPPTGAQVTAFANAVSRVVRVYKAAFNNPNLLKVDLCGMAGYSGSSSRAWTHDFSTTTAVMDIVGGKANGGLIDALDWDWYSNGPPNFTESNGKNFVTNELLAQQALCVKYGTQWASGELGIGGTGAVQSSPPNNWSPAAWGQVLSSWMVTTPASGPGSIARFEIFDIGGDGVFLDGRGGVYMPGGQGPAFAGAIKTAAT